MTPFFGKTKPSEFLQAMVDGLREAVDDDRRGVRMATFGTTGTVNAETVCYGCAATWALHHLATVDPDPEAFDHRAKYGVYPRYYWVKDKGVYSDPVVQDGQRTRIRHFEEVIDRARKGYLQPLAAFCDLPVDCLLKWSEQWYVVSDNDDLLVESGILKVEKAIKEMQEAGL